MARSTPQQIEHLDPAGAAAMSGLLWAKSKAELSRITMQPPSNLTFVTVPDRFAPLSRMLYMSGAPISTLLRRRKKRNILNQPMRIRSDALTVLLRNEALQLQLKLGGAELGVGREGTVVYTSDELPSTYSDANQLCVWAYGDTKSACSSDIRVSEAEGTVAVKDIPDENYAMLESMIHEKLYAWFKAAGKLHVTPLHPVINCADVTFAGGKTHRLVFYRAMAGDTSMLRLAPVDIARLGVAVLESLVVLHANKTLHADIKPHNVLYTFDDGRYVFALGDFGLMEPASDMLIELSKGGSPSGTDGYISPLLLRNDSENRVYTRFQMVADAIGLPHEAGGWESVFDRRRAVLVRTSPAGGVSPGIYKADLHSLALTLLSLLRWTAARTPEAALQANPLLTALISRLMFFRKGDFKSAFQALSAAKRLCRTLELSSTSLHATGTPPN